MSPSPSRRTTRRRIDTRSCGSFAPQRQKGNHDRSKRDAREPDSEPRNHLPMTHLDRIADSERGRHYPSGGTVAHSEETEEPDHEPSGEDPRPLHARCWWRMSSVSSTGRSRRGARRRASDDFPVPGRPEVTTYTSPPIGARVGFSKMVPALDRGHLYAWPKLPRLPTSNSAAT